MRPPEPPASPAHGPGAASSRIKQAPLLAAFFLSGVAALGFELLWIRFLGLALGAETFGLLAVLVGFFGGLALGAAGMHTAVRRVRHPVRLYAVCEAIIAAYGLVSPWLFLAVMDAIPSLVGNLVGDNQSAIALSVNVVVAGLLLLPATVPMGVTTVALVEAWRRVHDAGESHYGVGRLYAANTLGATAGIVGSTYWLLPALGAAVTEGTLAAACHVAAFLSLRWQRRSSPTSEPAAPSGASGPEKAPSTLAPYLLLGATGLAAIGFETIGTQVLTQILRNTVYTFANVLAVYLVGTSLGAWLYTRRRVREWSADRDAATISLLWALTMSVFVAMAVLRAAPHILGVVAPADSTYTTYLAGEILIISLAFLPPTMLMGATFSHLLGQLALRGVGYGYAVNTLAGAAAPLLFGLLLMRPLGLGWTMTAVAGVYGLTALALAIRRGAGSRRVLTGVVIAGLAALVTHSPLALVQVPAGYTLIARKQGLHGTVSVSERPFSVGAGTATRLRLLQVNQHFIMGGALGGVERRMGHLSMLVAHAPRSVLFLGVGTGITAGTALADRDVQRVDAVELVPEVLGFLDLFFEFNRNLALEHRVTLHASDARRFVRASPTPYDLIVGELFHPSVNGAGGLFTREHFAATRRLLAPGGVFVQWLPLYQLTARDLATIVRTFVEIFPEAHSLLGTYNAEAVLGLIGAIPDLGRTGFDMARVERLLSSSAGPSQSVRGPTDLLAAYMTDASGLRRFAGPGPVNSDLNQRVLFDAPLSLGREIRAAHRSLEALWPFRMVFPDNLLLDRDPAAVARWRAAARATISAADRFVTAELLRAQAGRDSLPPAALSEYLAAYEADPLFPNALQTLFELAGRHPDQAAEVLGEMNRRNPADARLAKTTALVRGARDASGIIEILRGYLLGR